MNKNTKNIAIIPARSGSKRIPNKNIRSFCGKKMIIHTVDIVRKSFLKNNIFVSTDSSKIKNICNKNDIFCDVLRPKKLSNDKASVIDVLIYETERLSKIFPKLENIILILPCSPLIEKKDLNKSFQKYKLNRKKNIIQSVLKYKFNFNWLMKKENSLLKKAFTDKQINRFNIIKNLYYDSGNITIFNINHIPNILYNLKNKMIGYEINFKNGIDIDYEEDWELAEIIYMSKK